MTACMDGWMGECLQRPPKSLGASVSLHGQPLHACCSAWSPGCPGAPWAVAPAAALCFLWSIRVSFSPFWWEGRQQVPGQARGGFFTDRGKLREVGEACLGLNYHICTRLRTSCDKPEHQQVWLLKVWIHTSPPCFLLG